MAERVFQQRGPDRRRHHRGGRRPTDVEGYTPLVFVIDPRPGGRDTCEAILAKLRFAVAPFDSAEQAIRVVAALRPDIILATADQVERVRSAIAPYSDQLVPVLPITENDVDATALIESIRMALRQLPRRRTVV